MILHRNIEIEVVKVIDNTNSALYHKIINTVATFIIPICLGIAISSSVNDFHTR